MARGAGGAVKIPRRLSAGALALTCLSGVAACGLRPAFLSSHQKRSGSGADALSGSPGSPWSPGSPAVSAPTLATVVAGGRVDAAAGPAAALTPSAPPADPVVGDRIPVGGAGGSVAVTATDDDVAGGVLFPAPAGMHFYGVEVAGCAGPGERSVTFDGEWFSLRLPDGTEQRPDSSVKKPELIAGPVGPGRCLSGWLTFTIPRRVAPSAVLYDGSRRLRWTIPAPEKPVRPTRPTRRARR